MGIMVWSEKLSVGIQRFDEEHKKLIGMLNSLHDEMLKGKAGSTVMGTLLGNLIRYAQTHFANEEALFKVTSYPMSITHIREHDAFKKKVGELEAAYQTGTSGISSETMKFLKDWLTKHILGTDMQYKDYFMKKGVK